MYPYYYYYYYNASRSARIIDPSKIPILFQCNSTFGNRPESSFSRNCVPFMTACNETRQLIITVSRRGGERERGTGGRGGGRGQERWRTFCYERAHTHTRARARARARTPGTTFTVVVASTRTRGNRFHYTYSWLAYTILISPMINRYPGVYLFKLGSHTQRYYGLFRRQRYLSVPKLYIIMLVRTGIHSYV